MHLFFHKNPEAAETAADPLQKESPPDPLSNTPLSTTKPTPPLSLSSANAPVSPDAPAAADVPVESPHEYHPTTLIATHVSSEQDRALYRALLAGLYDAILIIDPKGYIIGSNPRVESFFGYSEANLWNKSCVDLIPKMTPRVLDILRSHTESGRFTIVNATGLCKDGTSFPAEIAVNRIHLLQKGDLILSVRNLSRREKARLKHEMALEALQDSAAGIVVCRADGRVDYVNPAFLSLLQYEEEKDVLKAYIGDFCTCTETVSAMIKTPSTHGSWMGKLEMHTRHGDACEFLATSATKVHKRGSQHIVITLTPLPRTIG